MQGSFAGPAILAAAVCSARLTVASSAVAGTLIPVPPVPGSVQTNAYGINDSNVIVGSYFDSSNVEHGYFGTLDGNYTTFDYTENTVNGTEPRSINNDGYITGFAPDSTRAVGYEFVRKPSGAIVTVSNGVPFDGVAQGMTDHAVSVGDYFNSDYTVRHGYEAKAGVYKREIKLSVKTTRTEPRGINSSGVVVGLYDPYPNYHGFLWQNGATTPIDYPDARVVSTILEGINNNGLVTGWWTETNGDSHAFTLHTTTNTFTPFKVKGAAFVQLWAANTAGFIALNTDAGFFIYCPRKPANCPANGKPISMGKPIRVRSGQPLVYHH